MAAPSETSSDRYVNNTRTFSSLKVVESSGLPVRLLSIEPVGIIGSMILNSEDNNIYFSTGIAWVKLLSSGTLGALNDLSDVVITAATTKNIIQYNGTNWVNLDIPTAFSGATPTGLILGTTATSSADGVAFGNGADAGVGSVAVGLNSSATHAGAISLGNGTTSIASGFFVAPVRTDPGGGGTSNVLYRSSTDEFVLDTANGDLDGLSDVVITAVANKNILQYNGSNWVNLDIPTAFAGATATGLILGASTTANTNAVAFGNSSTASGISSISFGLNSSATSTNTVSIGVGAGATIQGPENVLLGTNSGSGMNNVLATFNTLVGSNAGINITSGDNNTFVGYNTGVTLTTGSGNTLLGIGTNTQVNSDNCVCLGINAYGGGSNCVSLGANSTTAASGVAVGANATSNTGIAVGNGAKGAVGCISVGAFSGNTNMSIENLCIGDGSLFDATASAIGNSIFGYAGGINITDGDHNTLIGNRICQELTTGSRNVGVGKSNYIAPTVNDSVSIGYIASLGSDYGVSIGYLTGSQLLGVGSIAIGNTVLNNVGCVTSNTVAIGTSVGINVTTGISNILLGHGSAAVLSTGSRNIIMGVNSDTFAATIDAVAIGNTALSGDNGISIGTNAGSRIVGADYNIAIGTGSLNSISTSAADNNIAVGQLAGTAISSGTNNTCIGLSAGGSITSGFNNICLGLNSDIVSSGLNAIAIGNTARAGTQSISIGRDAGVSASSGNSTICIGAFSTVTTVASDAIAIGTTATAGSLGISLGDNAGVNITTGTANVCIGAGAGFGSTTSAVDNCVLIGTGADSVGTGGVAIGNLTNVGGTGGVAIGNTAAANNFGISLGDNAGFNITTGTANVCIGNGAGNGSTTSAINNCVLIGTSADSVAAGGVAIGNLTLIGGTAIGGVAIGDTAKVGGTGGVAIGNTAAANNFGISLGDNAGINIITGTANVCIGNGAGNGSTTSAVNNCVLIGTGADSVGTGGVAIGNLTNVGGAGGISIGNSASGIGLNSICMGVNAYVGADYAIAIGGGTTQAGAANALGIDCISIGRASGGNTSTGANNIAIGSSALASMLTTSQKNVAVGRVSGTSITTGYNNSLYGDNSGAAITAGFQNTCVGPSAGSVITTGDDNICIGVLSNTAAGTVVGGIAIGGGAICNSGAVVIGGSVTSSGVQGFFVKPVRGGGAITENVRWNSTTGEFTYDSSSLRYKENVADAPDYTSILDNINVKTFDWKTCPNGSICGGGGSDIGMIAEEMYPLRKEFVPLNSEGQPNSIRYDRLTLVLWQEAQKQRIRVTTLETQVTTLETQVATLISQVAALMV